MTSPLPLTQFPEERRLASVLFAEVQGFTGQADKIDYETMTNTTFRKWVGLGNSTDSMTAYKTKAILRINAGTYHH